MMNTATIKKTFSTWIDIGRKVLVVDFENKSILHKSIFPISWLGVLNGRTWKWIKKMIINIQRNCICTIIAHWINDWSNDNLQKNLIVMVYKKIIQLFDLQNNLIIWKSSSKADQFTVSTEAICVIVIFVNQLRSIFSKNKHDKIEHGCFHDKSFWMKYSTFDCFQIITLFEKKHWFYAASALYFRNRSWQIP